jgi:hypothetical protein
MPEGIKRENEIPYRQGKQIYHHPKHIDHLSCRDKN